MKKREFNYKRLSELLAIGIKWFQADQYNTILFNDGTIMSWRWIESVNDSGTDFSDMRFYCYKDNEVFDIVDDVAFKSKPVPYIPKYGTRESVWAKAFTEQEVNNVLNISH